jgi:SAM-dependent methyltransferase
LQPQEYERLAASEERMWWFRGLHANLIAAWQGAGGQDGVVLDAGCGTGGLLKRLAAAAPDARLVGVELDQGAAALARQKCGDIVAGTVHALPFEGATFDAVFSADVLCHRGVEQTLALAEFRRCLKRGGVLALNLPACRWLFSGHDVAVDNARRYGAGELRRMLVAAGFVRVRVAHWNSVLFPLMVIRRKILPTGGAASDVALLPAPLERAFLACVAAETALAKRGLKPPFGGSLLATAERP